MGLRERRNFASGLETNLLWLYIITLLFELARRIGLAHSPENAEYHSDEDAENPETEGSVSGGISQQGPDPQEISETQTYRWASQLLTPPICEYHCGIRGCTWPCTRR